MRVDSSLADALGFRSDTLRWRGPQPAPSQRLPQRAAFSCHCRSTAAGNPAQAESAELAEATVSSRGAPIQSTSLMLGSKEQSLLLRSGFSSRLAAAMLFADGRHVRKVVSRMADHVFLQSGVSRKKLFQCRMLIDKCRAADPARIAIKFPHYLRMTASELVPRLIARKVQIRVDGVA